MIVERMWTANKLRNFIMILACPETGEAAAIDPLEVDLCLERARQRGWRITRIINTHEHGDHIAGNARMVAETGADLLAPKGARIADVDGWLVEGDQVTIGQQVARVLDTPGHTMTHISLSVAGPALICGDTIFSAGVGNCHNGGDGRALYRTIHEKLLKLPADTQIYPGHEYMEANLRFSLDREPNNEDAARLLSEIADADAEQRPIMTLADEQRVNPFMRLRQEAIIEGLRRDVPHHPVESSLEVFLALRELRNSW